MKAQIYFRSMNLDTAEFGIYPDVPEGVTIKFPDNCFNAHVSLAAAGATESMTQTEIVERCLAYLREKVGLEKADLPF